MTFNLSIWKKQATQRLRGAGKWIKQRANEDVPYAAYGALCSLSMFPLVEAAQQGQLSPVVLALGSVAGGVGVNLIANQIEAWKNRSDAVNESEVADWVAQNAVQTDVRAALDAILSELKAITVARENVKPAEQSELIALLRTELKQLGNQRKFAAELKGTGAIAQGKGALAVGKQRGKHNIAAQKVTKSAIGDGAKVVINEAAQDTRKPTEKTFRETYLKWLMSDIAPLRLSGIDLKTANERQASELKLSAVYTALFTREPEQSELLERQAKERRQLERFERETPKLSALAALNQHQHLVLLGDPGSGKSTFVNFVALCMAGEMLKLQDANLALLRQPLPQDDERAESKRDKEKPKPQPWKHGALLPVRVVLRDFAARGLPAPDQPVNGDTLWNFIASELGQTLQGCADVLQRTLLEKGGLVLLDGLDEVPDANQRREQVKEVVQGFTRNFPACRILVTSRTYAYQRQDWKLQDFAEVVLSPFEPAQIKHFIDRWYAHVGPLRGLDSRDSTGKTEVLKRAIARSERLAELATSPLLLTLMASLHAWRGGSLPEKREELYNDAVELLLDQWESQKLKRRPDGTLEAQEPSLAGYLKVGKDAIRAELNRIAFEAHRDQPQLTGTADIPHERLLARLYDIALAKKTDLTDLDRYVRDRAGLLAERGNDVYAFPHRTFQEYLAACYLTDADFPRQLVKLLSADVERWREVTLLAGAKACRGTASAAWNLAEVLCPSDPPVSAVLPSEATGMQALLAAQTLIENEGARLSNVDEWNKPKHQRVSAWMHAIVERGWLAPRERTLAGNALAVLGDPRDLEELVEVPAGKFLMGSVDSDAMAASDEKPQHTLDLPAFKIGKYPVTNKQYLSFVAETGHDWKWEEERKAERANHPATGVTWYDANAYCEWLTTRWRGEGKISPAEIVHLPSEAEWEKAARGTDGNLWPWGDDWDVSRCNNSDLGLSDTSSVGMFPQGASSFGCLDMAGNVWEWTNSLWGKDYSETDFKYPYDWGDGREDINAGRNILRVLRGGSFYFGRLGVRCAYRVGLDPDLVDGLYGFRIVVSPISPRSAPSAGSGQAL